jgi:hypothetical protein
MWIIIRVDHDGLQEYVDAQLAVYQWYIALQMVCYLE